MPRRVSESLPNAYKLRTSRSSSFGSIQDFRRLLLAHWCCHYEGEKFPKSKTGQESSQEKHQPIIVQDAYFATDLSNLKTASSHISFAIKSHQKKSSCPTPIPGRTFKTKMAACNYRRQLPHGTKHHTVQYSTRTAPSAVPVALLSFASLTRSVTRRAHDRTRRRYSRSLNQAVAD